MHRRIAPLTPVVQPRAWGVEVWLNAAREPGGASLAGAKPPLSLRQLTERHPETLGRWVRLVHGDKLPFFVKTLQTRFLPMVHLGLKRRVRRTQLLAMLVREQELLRDLRRMLDIRSKRELEAFQSRYERWALTQARAKWRDRHPGRHKSLVASMRPFLRGARTVRRGARPDVEASLGHAGGLLAGLRDNRARLAGLFHEIDLGRHLGRMLLVEGGLIHSIAGLSLQSHPVDAWARHDARLLARLRTMLRGDGAPARAEALVEEIRRRRLHRPTTPEPKSESWLVARAGGKVVLTEPQQDSDTTLSLADFYTPFAWGKGLVFRKGSPESGLSREELARTLAQANLRPMRLADILRAPVLVDRTDAAAGNSALERFVDDSATWPYFTVYRITLRGRKGSTAFRQVDHPEGAFQHLIVARGDVLVVDADGNRTHLDPATPAFVPATLEGGYRIESSTAAEVLVLGVPGPYDAMPAPRPAKVRAPSFLDTLPVSLAFGTSGLRGPVAHITDLEAFINTRGYLRYLFRSRQIEPGATVAIGGDLRPSTPRIMAAVARAVEDSGLRVQNAGTIPTPALIHHGLVSRIVSVMVTGSHIPFDRNGIKFNGIRGEVLKHEESAILEEVRRVRADEYARTAHESIFGRDGMLKRGEGVERGTDGELALPAVSSSAESAYMRRYLDAFGGKDLAGRTVIVFQHSAVGRDMLARLLESLGAKVIRAGRSDTFVPIDTENITDPQLNALDAMARDQLEKGLAPDAIVSTDGDSDRPLVAAIQDSARARATGRLVAFINGDLLGLLVARSLKAQAVAVPISSNDAVSIGLAESGIPMVTTRIGSPYVIEAMEELRQRMPGRRVVGWEANGGFLVGADLRLRDGRIRALPTRDAVLPILVVLAAAARAGRPLASMLDGLPDRHGRSGLLDDMPPEVGRAIVRRFWPVEPPDIASLAKTAPIVQADFRGGEVLIWKHGSAAPHRLGARTALARRLAESRASLERILTSADGFDGIYRLNGLDGLRIHFLNGDIMHVRPSGNAPQLRVYAVSGTQSRSADIVARALAEPDGLLRRLQAAAGS